MRIRVRNALALALKDVMIYFGEDTTDVVPAMGIGGRRAAESGNQFAETVQEGKSLLAPYPGEAATKAEKQRWCREAKRRLPPDLQTLRGGVWTCRCHVMHVTCTCVWCMGCMRVWCMSCMDVWVPQGRRDDACHLYGCM